MLVEDDKSLREIYGVRLLAEGYDIVSAGDGEEALAMAIKERPKLIVADVMMPKISGFDMLDILRSTTETKDIKVIMMTALSSEEQRQRGEQLGADRYLVKSQVGIEDVIRVVHEVLGDQAGAAAPAAGAAAVPPRPAGAAAMTRPAAPTMPVARPVAPQPMQQPMPAQPAAYQPAPSPAMPAGAMYGSMTAPQPIAPQPTAPTPPSVKNRVIQPLNNPSVSKVDINELLDRELAKEAGIDVDKRPEVTSAASEKSMINAQLNQFTPGQPATAPAPAAPTSAPALPTIQIDAQGHVSMPGNQQPPAAPTPPTPPQPPTPAV